MPPFNKDSKAVAKHLVTMLCWNVKEGTVNSNWFSNKMLITPYVRKQLTLFLRFSLHLYTEVKAANIKRNIKSWDILHRGCSWIDHFYFGKWAVNMVTIVIILWKMRLQVSGLSINIVSSLVVISTESGQAAIIKPTSPQCHSTLYSITKTHCAWRWGCDTLPAWPTYRPKHSAVCLPPLSTHLGHP